MAFAQQESEQITELLLETLKVGRGDTVRAAQYLKENITCFPQPMDSNLADAIIADPEITTALVLASKNAHPTMFIGMYDSQMITMVQKVLYSVFLEAGL